MTLKPFPDFETASFGYVFQFPGHEISWAGECPWTGGFCFGTGEGKLLVPKSGTLENPGVFDLAKSGEAINGVAFGRDNLLAASTRDEVVVYRLETLDKPLLPVGAAFDGGAHGVVATFAGGFVAPLGYDGLLLMDVRNDGTYTKRVVKPDWGDQNFYKLARLSATGGGDAFACASRKGGLIGMKLPSNGDFGSAVVHASHDLDAVDVCSLDDPSRPFAVASLWADGSILLSHDVFKNESVFMLKYEIINGTPYTILSQNGHIFVLSSESLAIFPGLSRRFLLNESLDRPSDIGNIPIQASEAYLVYKSGIFLEEEERVSLFEINTLVDIPSPARNSKSTNANHNYHWDSSQSHSFSLSPVS